MVSKPVSKPLSEAGDLIALRIREAHSYIDQGIAQVGAAKSVAKRRARLESVSRAWAIHAVVEESTLYVWGRPAIDEELWASAQVQHGLLDHLVQALWHAQPDYPVIGLVAVFRDLWRSHTRFEERTWVPAVLAESAPAQHHDWLQDIVACEQEVRRELGWNPVVYEDSDHPGVVTYRPDRRSRRL